MLGLTAAIGLFCGNLCLLLGLGHLHGTLLLQTGELLVTLDIEALLFGIEVLGLDEHAGVLFDAVALLPLVLGDQSELGQAHGIKGIVFFEVVARGLVEPGEGNRLQFKTSLKQIFTERTLHLLNELGSLFVELVHTQAGSDGA